MATPLAKHSFDTGEISPTVLGRQDVERYHSGCTTARNVFVDYNGPLRSRAGTAFVGFSKQTGRNYPPRLITFEFAANQGLALEFGNFYMRPISEGAFVTETPIGISNIANTNPCQVTINQVLGVGTATSVNTSVIASYAPFDTITLAGGAYTQAGVLTINQTYVLNTYINSPGTGYAPGDTVVFAGGTHSGGAASGTIATTQVVSATVHAGGTGGTNGTQTVTGTTGIGTPFQASVTVAGGAITAVLSITLNGVYTVNPSTLGAEPVTGAGLTGAQLAVVMGAQSMTISSGGIYTANPAAGTLTQFSTTGSGTGLVVTGIFAPYQVAVTTAGQYATLPSNPVNQASTSGTGVGAEFNLTSTNVSAPINAGDWIYISGVGGTTQLNGETFVVGTVVGQVLTLTDVYGNSVDATSFGVYTSGGTVARIYTLTTPYAEADLPWLKFVESADVMSLCLVDQVTGTEYASQDLTRITDTNWTFSPVIPAPSILPPTPVSGTASASGSVNYAYVLTSVSPIDGTESIASSIITVANAVDIASTAGSITLTWTGVTGVQEYYVYKALPTYSAPVPAGAQFSYAGLSHGNSFVDSNITADATQSPPTHQNPFGRGVITGGTPVSPGTGYTTITLTPNSGTGTGGVLTGVLNNGSLVGVIVNNEGVNYKPGDSITITGNGTGAAATLQIGPQSGTYPSVASYFQERRAYANTLNNPDTYFMSQPGAYTNFDVRNPTISSDAIIGSPWAVQVNGVQWMIQTSGGLLVMTGLRAWLLVGAGSFATNVQAISPSSQNVTPQAFSGCSAQIQPIVVNYDVVYVDPNGVYYYDLPYQLYALSEPIDLTDVSQHLFTGYTVQTNCYCEKPYRLIWSVRSDGALLSLTYYKTQKISGWTRHDTDGLFVGTCSVQEPPVNAAYFATQRFPGVNTAYMIERMDNRIWRTVEDVWAVDCALAYPQPQPAAKLTISSATGLGSLTGATGIVGGSGYSSATTGTVIDQFGGTGSGAVPTLTFAGGVLTNVTFVGGNQGSGYTQPSLVLTDPAGSAGGSGASAKLTLANTTTLTTSAGVFSSGDVGAVVRAAGGIAVITAYISTTQVTANVLVPFTATIPDSAGIPPAVPPIAAGSWTKTMPTTVVTGLRHLAGMTVTGLADGNVIPPTVVSASGSITLATPASAIVVGLGFKAQFQDVPVDAGESPTVQGQRKKIAATTLRVAGTLGLKVGTNQPDGAAQSPPQIDMTWNNLQAPAMTGSGAPNFPPVPYNALATPLRTGDVRVATQGGTATPGQLCVEQDQPLPMNLVAIYSEILFGDTPQTAAPKQQAPARRAAPTDDGRPPFIGGGG